MSETDLKYALLLAAPRELPTLRLFLRQVMRVKLKEPERTIAIGIKGQSDVYAIERGTARHIELETKDVHTVITPQQLAWRDFCLEWGIPHLFLRARAGESSEETVRRWCDEVRELLKSR